MLKSEKTFFMNGEIWYNPDEVINRNILIFKENIYVKMHKK